MEMAGKMLTLKMKVMEMYGKTFNLEYAGNGIIR